MIGAFLEFMEVQMRARPDLVTGLTTTSLERAQALVGDLQVDAEEDLGEDNAI